MDHEPVVVAPPRRRWPRRLLIGLNIFVAVTLVATAGAYGYMKWRLGQIDRIGSVIDVLRNKGDDDPGQPMNVLLVGSDSRKNISKEERKQFGSEAQVGGERSDTIIVLHIDPREQRAAILSIPRDLYVPIAGTKGSGRINTAFEGGPERLVETIRQALGIEIDHYAQVDFNGFRGIVSAVGGVNVYFPAPAKDRFTGLNITKAGCATLSGDDALKFVRSRHYTYYESGRWRSDPTGDLGRIQRQQDFIRRVIRKSVTKVKGLNPLTINRLVQQGVENLSVDSAFSTKDMIRLAQRFKSLEPDTVDMLTLPVTEANIGGAAVLRLKQPDAQTIVARFTGQTQQQPGAGAPLPPVLPGSISVRVLNGTGASGQATEVANDLSKVNFGIAGKGDADSFRYDKTSIRYGTGQLEKAKLLQAYVGGTAELKEDRTLRGIDLVLVTGADFEGVATPPKAGATTSSTAAPTTTTTAKAPEPKGATQPEC